MPKPYYAHKCDDCGKFSSGKEGGGASWAYQYDFVAMEASYDHHRCPKCTALMGPVQSNARPSNGDMKPYQGMI